jgi:hypothetical protein
VCIVLSSDARQIVCKTHYRECGFGVRLLPGETVKHVSQREMKSEPDSEEERFDDIAQQGTNVHDRSLPSTASPDDLIAFRRLARFEHSLLVNPREKLWCYSGNSPI